tara:strand:+ start:156 stop:1022 length:867 start_codon:yes stop_codon:yes gene_type:complete
VSTFLISGATGYVGTFLSKVLAKDGHLVHALSQTKQPLGRIVWHLTDGTYQSVDNAMEIVKPHVVVHLAAHYNPKHSSEEIRTLLRSNVEFGTHLMEAAVNHGCSNFINTESYWQNAKGELYSPANLYAATKQAFKDITHFYSETFGLSVLHLKLFDVYGPNDPRPKLFSLLERARSEKKALDMTQGDQIIRLVHVYDVVSAYQIAIKKLLESEKIIEEEYSVSGEPQTIREIVRAYQDIVGADLVINWGAIPYSRNQIMIPYSGNALPGWSPAISLSDGLQLLRGKN